ncbi:MAG TPA: hypothetical protein VK041_02025 [Opitutales bacterium]|nr:hypothetical protein [Opitutales bacterium]
MREESVSPPNKPVFTPQRFSKKQYREPGRNILGDKLYEEQEFEARVLMCRRFAVGVLSGGGFIERESFDGAPKNANLLIGRSHNRISKHVIEEIKKLDPDNRSTGSGFPRRISMQASVSKRMPSVRHHNDLTSGVLDCGGAKRLKEPMSL